MATKYDLPNASGSTSNLTAEQTEYERLYKLKPRTQIGNISFTSTTSSTSYNTSIYNSGAFANTGEQGMLNVLADVLSGYSIKASDFNAKAEQSDLTTLLTVTKNIDKVISMGGIF